jgi:hypothetical protein
LGKIKRVNLRVAGNPEGIEESRTMLSTPLITSSECRILILTSTEETVDLNCKTAAQRLVQEVYCSKTISEHASGPQDSFSPANSFIVAEVGEKQSFGLPYWLRGQQEQLSFVGVIVVTDSSKMPTVYQELASHSALSFLILSNSLFSCF